MALKDNRDMVIANIAQQVVAMLIFMFVPRILGSTNYAQVVYATTLLGFITFADFGLSFVYGRKMPAIYARHDAIEIYSWDSSTLLFRLYTSFLFSAVISLCYFTKYGDAINAALLLLVAPVSIVVQFYTASNIAREHFSITRDINLLQSLGRLTILPSVVIAGVRGWMMGQLISAVLVLCRKDMRSCCSRHLTAGASINWRLIVDNLPEAIHLGLITTLWMQLLYSGRIFASFIYPDNVIAQYGIAGTAYQVVASIMIAAFIPQTIKVYKLLEKDPAKAVNYVFGIILVAQPFIVTMVVIGCLIAPWFFIYFFPEYQVDIRLIAPLIVSLVGYPVILTLGSLLIGTKRNKSYLSMIVAWCLICWVLASKGQFYFGYNSAAIAQLISLLLYAISLICLVSYVFSDVIRSKWRIFVSLAVIVLSLASCLYFIQ